MTPYWGRLIGGFVFVVIGACLFVFATGIQTLALGYRPPDWYEPYWREIASRIIRDWKYVWFFRILGLGFIALGVLTLRG